MALRRPGPSRRWFRPATSSASACCGRHWLQWPRRRRKPGCLPTTIRPLKDLYFRDDLALALADAVANRAEAREKIVPFILRRDADNPQKAGAAEAHPLDQGERFAMRALGLRANFDRREVV